MEWDLDDNGNVILMTMASFRTGKLLDMSIAVRMMFSPPLDEPGATATVVQAAMTVPQVREFCEVLLKTVDEVLAPPSGRLPN